MSYKTTLGFSTSLPTNDSWNTNAGHEKFLKLIRIFVEDLSPNNDISLAVSWDEEVQNQLASAKIPVNAQLDPAPDSVRQAALILADTYVTRWRMRNRLAEMRERTAVALQPRGAWDDKSETPQLMYRTRNNSSYSKYLERFH